MGSFGDSHHFKTHPVREPIAIVGGGIAGLALGWRLRMLGIPFCIYERAIELQEIGAGLLLTANATGVLDGLGVLSEALNRGHSNIEFRILNQSGRRLSTLRQPTIPNPALKVVPKRTIDRLFCEAKGISRLPRRCKSGRATVGLRQK